ncbi:AAA family protein [Cardiosporidium cionae]|uniref:AAA family protein n=1 Tax=Cardiosporidium cionae TaxID=476202 RepID=A0ABQ7J7U1_9APIC|nr:AAA family protein [Cardiosporidium cionae]|eukprot:KAF8820058.1 AAA family protein [Cardiosporidium cionae]
MTLFREAVKRSNVIIATCIGSGHEIMEDEVFPRVIIDECSQSIEPSNLIPLGRNCSNLVLIGDHKQLPPTILSSEARLNGNITPIHLLDSQRRMHPSIADFSCSHFYDGKSIKSVATKILAKKKERKLKESQLYERIRKRMNDVFKTLQVSANAEISQRNSKMNKQETLCVLSTLWACLNAGGVDALQIGILTPYDAQKSYLKKVDSSISKCIEVNSVDGFQGREKDLIIFSGVRSNFQGNVGFLKDGRRMNVMLTRAKRGLIVVGDGHTLWNEERNWRPWLQWIYDSEEFNGSAQYV